MLGRFDLMSSLEQSLTENDFEIVISKSNIIIAFDHQYGDHYAWVKTITDRWICDGIGYSKSEVMEKFKFSITSDAVLII